MKKFLIIDAHALIYRAFHAFPKTLISPDGQLTNAVYGFTRILLNVISKFDPEYLIICFDHKDKTLRSKKYQAYKANRAEMPDELKPQIDLCKQVTQALNIPKFEMPGYEADDLIGSMSRILNDNHQVLSIIVSGDKDLFQLVDSNTQVFIPSRGKYSKDILYDKDKVLEKMGVGPELIVDLKALMGDASDNIPGVKGIGPKTAVKLLQEFRSLDGVYDFVETRLIASLQNKKNKIKPALISKLKNNQDTAYLSRELAQIETNLDLEFDLETCRVKNYDKTKIIKLFDQLGFKSLVNKLPEDEFEQSVQQALL